MGKKDKAHRQKVEARNRRIKEGQSRFNNILRKQLEAKFKKEAEEQAYLNGEVMPPEVVYDATEDQLMAQINQVAEEVFPDGLVPSVSITEEVTSETKPNEGN